MKKVLAILLAVLSVFGCFALSASAAEGDAPATTPSGLYVGQLLEPGQQIKSAFEDCESFSITYSVGKDDIENVTSALQTKFADAAFVGLVSFRDSISSFASEYESTYTIKGEGASVDEMEVKNGEFKTGIEIQNSLSKDEQKKLKGDITLSIDYDYAKTTYYQYTNITKWEVTSVVDTENNLTVKVKAVYETREATGFENFVEGVYTNWCAFLDKLGDVLLKIVPAMIAVWAKVLGKGWIKK